MVELRKRKTPPPAPEKPARKKSATAGVKGKLDQVKQAVLGSKKEGETTASSASPVAGGTIDIEGFGGQVETHEGNKVTLKSLLEESKAGVVLFTYPKASTPGCTNQACLFRDAYDPLTATGLSIYGLSADSPKANTTFKTKQNLPYPLLCDPAGTLLKAISFHKAPKSATRGVFVVDKSGKVLAVEKGGPQATVDVVKRVVDEMGGDPSKVAGPTVDESNKKAADTAGEVADTAAKLDASPAPPA